VNERVSQSGQEKDDKREGLSEVKTIGAYWTLLAGVVPQERLAKFVRHLDNPNEFKTPHRVPALSRDHPKFAENGDYWNGGVWAPTNYMVPGIRSSRSMCALAPTVWLTVRLIERDQVLRGLTKNGQDELAYDIASNHHRAVVKVYELTGTVWENYSPSRAAPGSPAKKYAALSRRSATSRSVLTSVHSPAHRHFVGWSGLGPIAIFLEYVIGLRPDVESGTARDTHHRTRGGF
jgi:hypothetical protein